MKHKILSLAILATAIGCTHSDDDATVDATPPPPAFEGQVDKSLLGKWGTANGSSQLEMTEDGKVHMTGVAHTPKGDQKIDQMMEWKCNGDRLLFKPDSGAIQQYKFSVEKDQLTLKTSKTSTIYSKSKS